VAKKVSACRVEVRVIYHCEIGNKCDFYKHNICSGLCAHLYIKDDTCTLRAAQRAGRQQSRRRA
jgi:hypothetical protein